MDELKMQFRVGVVIVATMISTVILILIFGRMPNFYRTYTIYVKLKEAPGVTEGTPVHKNGVLIGRVSGKPELIDNIEPMERVRVPVRIDNDRALYTNELVHVAYSALGDAKLEFVQAAAPGERQSVPPGYEFRGEASSEPLKMLSEMQTVLNTMGGSVVRASDDLAKLTRKVDDLLEKNKDRIGNVIDEAGQTMRSIKLAADTANSLMADPQIREGLRNTLTEAPMVVADARKVVGKLGQTADLLNSNLENLEGLTKPLGKHGGELVDRLGGTLQNIDELVAQFSEVSRKLASGKGTIGQLLDNPDLYNNLNETVTNVNSIVSELRPMIRDVRPILDDARVFTDKIARHPEMLGVRGALERSPGIKWGSNGVPLSSP